MNIIQGELRNRIFRWRLNLKFLQKRDINPASMLIACPAISSLEQALLLKLGEILSNCYLADFEALGQIVDLDIPFVFKELKNSSMPCGCRYKVISETLTDLPSRQLFLAVNARRSVSRASC